MKNFTLLTLALAILSCAAGISSSQFNPAESDLAWCTIVAVYALLTLLLRRWILKTKNGSALSFVGAVYGSTFSKMFLTMGIITVHLVMGFPNRWHFAFGVFGVFVAFTTLFVVDSQYLIRNREKN